MSALRRFLDWLRDVVTPPDKRKPHGLGAKPPR